MKIITAIENKKINEQLKNVNNLEILNTDIQYKEGILEYLEKNNNLNLIVFKENLPGQIKLLNLIKEIKKINNNIKIIIFINNNYLENYEKIKNVNYIYLEKITINNILKILNLEVKNNNENNKKRKLSVIQILGNPGSGKTIISLILIKIISKIKKEKILFIEDNKILNNILLKKYNINILNNNEIIKLENNIYLLNIIYLINNKTNILEYLKNIKNNYNYIIIDGKNKLINFEKIIDKKIYLLEANLIEINKSKNYIIKNNLEIIINKKNIFSIDQKIIEDIFNKKVFFEIDYYNNFNLFINNEFELKFLNKKLINKLLKILN